jgi:hypothetical protein
MQRMDENQERNIIKSCEISIYKHVTGLMIERKEKKLK